VYWLVFQTCQTCSHLKFFAHWMFLLSGMSYLCISTWPPLLHPLFVQMPFLMRTSLFTPFTNTISPSIFWSGCFSIHSIYHILTLEHTYSSCIFSISLTGI
jgi:hypothetical protein